MTVDEMIAIPCTRRAARELVDGTLRVQIDIEPMYKKRFMDLMGDMDILLAVVPLAYAPVPEEGEVTPTATSGRGFKDMGRLAQSAILICNDETFQQFAADNTMGNEPPSQKLAADFVKLRCKVASRKDLDTADGANTRYGALMAEFREWLKTHARPSSGDPF